MCPTSIATLALIYAGVSLTGGLTLLAVKKFRANMVKLRKE